MAFWRWLLLGCSLLGCASNADDDSRPSSSNGGSPSVYCPGVGPSDGTTSQALVGGAQDRYVNVPNASAAKQRAADVVVQLYSDSSNTTGFCNGTLISPGAVLTANHCITGGPNGVPAWGKKPPIYIGPGQQSKGGLPSVGPIETVDSAVRIQGTVPANSIDDVAVSFVDLPGLAYEAELALTGLLPEERPATADATRWGAVMMPEIRHPSFQAPTPQNVSGVTWTFGSPIYAAAFGQHQEFRQIGDGNELDRENQLWSKAGSSGFRLELGNSGSPLFVLRSDGTRDVFGVHNACSFYTNPCDHQMFWVDITRNDLAAWIRDQVIDKSRLGPDHLTWRARHPLPLGQTEWWKGDVEYYGPCRQADKDCDHWFDAHDSCPDMFNPFQEDSDDDGVGDRCDNCKTAANPLQENCNRAAEDAERYRVPSTARLGDACDPVPCPNSESNARFANEQCKPNAPQIDVSPGGQGQPTQQCSANLQQDRVKTWALGSNHGGSAFKTVAVPETSARFCQVTPNGQQPAFRCDRWEIMSDAQLQVEGDGVNPDYPWHEVRFGNGTVLNPPVSGAPLTGWTYGTTVASNTWWFALDYQSWVTNAVTPSIPIPAGKDCCKNAAACGPGETPSMCLEGRFWLHAGPNLGSFGHGNNLANGYVDLTPDRGMRSYCPIPGYLAVGENAGGEPNGILSVPIDGDSALLPNASELFDTQILVPASTGLIAELLDDGSGRSLEDIETEAGVVDCGDGGVGSAFKASLFDAGTSLQSAAEPAAAAPGVDAAFLGVAVDADGTALSGFATADQGNIVLSGNIVLEASNGMVALAGGEDATTPASFAKLATPVLAVLPRALDVVDGNGGQGSVTLSLGLAGAEIATCRFESHAGTRCPVDAADVARGNRYAFASCSDGTQPGERVKIDHASLLVDEGAPNFGATSVRLRLHVFESDAGFQLPANNPNPPPAREDFAQVFSRTLGGTFVIGGVDAAGAPLHDLWFFDDAGVSHELPLAMGAVHCGASGTPGELGTVLAATTSFRTGLWLVDETTTASGGPRFRLLRYDSGVFDELASWSTPSDSTYLSTARDGAVLLTRGFPIGFMSEKITLSATGEVSVAARHGATDILAAAPVVGRSSISYVVSSAGHWEVRRIADLMASTGDCTSIGGVP
jgi:hypothetical protein